MADDLPHRLDGHMDGRIPAVVYREIRHHIADNHPVDNVCQHLVIGAAVQGKEIFFLSHKHTVANGGNTGYHPLFHRRRQISSRCIQGYLHFLNRRRLGRGIKEKRRNEQKKSCPHHLFFQQGRKHSPPPVNQNWVPKLKWNLFWSPWP